MRGAKPGTMRHPAAKRRAEALALLLSLCRTMHNLDGVLHDDGRPMKLRLYRAREGIQALLVDLADVVELLSGHKAATLNRLHQEMITELIERAGAALVSK